MGLYFGDPVLSGSILGILLFWVYFGDPIVLGSILGILLFWGLFWGSSYFGVCFVSLFGSPCDQDHSVLGTILGTPIHGNFHVVDTNSYELGFSRLLSGIPFLLFFVSGLL